ncbi:MAG TPA: AAA family ATPase, partial [Acidimicrobiales bacterium]|nr:AAA family ATPase [Acidimicrobiales bacterium]
MRGTVLLSRFRCDSLLKTGHGVDTYAATDVQSGSRVIVKRVAVGHVGDAVRTRLEHEAEVLRRLEGFSFGAPVMVASDSDFVCLVKPYVPGVTLEERISQGPLSVGSTLVVGVELLRSLEQAHDHGVLHRDVKPANVIVDEREPVERAVLVDFGFARSSALEQSLRDERVGTARYLAPEAAGLLGGPADERSDLYSVGILLFECLAGRPPFEADAVGEVLRQHLNTPAPQLRGLGVKVPRALDAIVQRLLRKDPAERYQSAGAAIRDLEAVADGLARGLEDPMVVIGLHDRRQALTEPSFVGRDAELADLGSRIDAARAGAGGLVLVESESGGGKTRLLEELIQQWMMKAWVLRGQAVDQAAQRPFELLEGVVGGILAACHETPGLAEEIRAGVGDRAEAVVAALPDLAPVLGEVQPSHLGPEAYGETRSISALSTLLDALGAPARPAVVILDDCQWADGPTLRLLAAWQERVHEEGTNVVLLAAFRTEEVTGDHVLRTVTPAAAIALAPFGTGDMRALVESMAGPLPEEAITTVASLSEGSPFMAAAVLRGLFEAEALVDGPSGWEVDEVRLAHVQTSRRAALFLVRRLELLAPATLELLSVGAVLGKEFGIGLAAELCGQHPDEVSAGLAEASRRRIVWVHEETRRASFFHDKLREALLSRLSADERRELHRLAALRLEATSPEQVFDLAYHFDAAGRADKATVYALEAAETARSQYSLDVALTHYRVAHRSVAGDDTATRARVAEGLGDVLTLLGSYDEAMTVLGEALSLADSDVRRAGLEGKLGDVAFKRGEQGLARGHLESAIRQLHRRLPRRAAGFLLAAVVEIVVQAAHTMLPRLFVGRRSLAGSEKEFLAIRLYSRLAYVYWFSAGKIPCAFAHLREMNLAERYPPTPELAQAYSEHAPVMTMVPWFGRGIAYTERSLAIRREHRDLWGQGQSLHFYGVVLYAASRYRECIEKCQQAVRLLDRTGDRWEMYTALWHIAISHYRLGELAEAVRVARRVHSRATSINDDAAAGISLSVWSRASEGRLPADLVAEQLAQRNEDAHTGTEVHVGEGIRLLGEGRLDEAVAMFEQAHGIARGAGLRQEYVAPVLPWLTTATRLQLERVPPYDVRQRRRLLRRTRRLARRGWRVARFYRNNAPHALRERALVAALDGDGRRAQRLLARSRAEAERQGARYERALTLRSWGQVGSILGWPGAEEARHEADAELTELVPRARAAG